jgi:hypothetical protein
MKLAGGTGMMSCGNGDLYLASLQALVAWDGRPMRRSGIVLLNGCSQGLACLGIA